TPPAAAKWVEIKTLATVKTHVHVLGFSADGNMLYASPGIDYLQTWHIADWAGKKIERNRARFAGFAPDGKAMGVGSKLSKPGRVEIDLIDWVTGARSWQSPAESAPVVQAAISRDGALLAVATLKETELLDAASGKVMAKINHGGQTIQTLAFSGDSHHL